MINSPTPQLNPEIKDAKEEENNNLINIADHQKAENKEDKKDKKNPSD